MALALGGCALGPSPAPTPFPAPAAPPDQPAPAAGPPGTARATAHPDEETTGPVAQPAGDPPTTAPPGSAPPPPPILIPIQVSLNPVAADTKEKDAGKEKGAEKGQDAGEEGKGGEKGKEPWYSVHEQGTVVTQRHPPFRSPYVGTNSLVPDEGAATTETATLYAAARLWTGGEVVFNPEIAGGTGLSGTSGIAGFPNGEATRVGVPEPTPYIARLFVRQTWGLDGPWEQLKDGPNQVAGHRDLTRASVMVGKMSATDNFDNNLYSHDPRTQFLNWSMMYNGAWDYPANVRGYTYGAVVELNTINWAVRYGVFAEPAVANGADFDPRFLKANGQILEVEEHWNLGEEHAGRLREWGFLNHAHMGNYREALELSPVDPDVTQTRTYRFKYGFGLNLEQGLTRELGLFVRLGWNDGHSESWAFTEIDRTAAVGLSLYGKAWGRPDDQVGVGAVVNGLSGPHRDYLAAGGIGFIIGDGRLNYAPEQILEGFYNWQVTRGILVCLGGQAANHPAYNADRGPVAIGSIRVHFEH
jgi:high affinity Mn2+ porin